MESDIGVYAWQVYNDDTSLFFIFSLFIVYFLFSSATASVARALSNNIDSLLGKAMRGYLQTLMPISVSYLSEYPDFFAFAMVILLIVILCSGVRESSYVNMGLTFLNLLTIVIIVVVGSIKGKIKFIYL